MIEMEANRLSKLFDAAGVMMFQKTVEQKHKTITDKISRYFTPILLIAL
jgi:hypothetical protein